MSSRSRTIERWAVWSAALLGPAAVTAALVGFSHQTQRDYVFIYLGLVAVIAFFRGLWPALACAGISASQGSKFSVVAVRTRKLSDEEKGWLGAYAALTHQLGGEFVRLEGGKVAATLARYISESQATEVVLGHRRQTRWHPLDTTSELIRRLAGVDVHILRARAPVWERAGAGKVSVR